MSPGVMYIWLADSSLETCVSTEATMLKYRCYTEVSAGLARIGVS